jgi:anti-sigma factor RsiW
VITAMNDHEGATRVDVPREVLLDLLPVYASGEASAATRALVEAHLATDTDLARRLHEARALPRFSPALPPELELRALHRTRGALALQRWLFGFAILFTALTFTARITFHGYRITAFRLLIFDYPREFGACLALALGFWIAYHALRGRLDSRGGALGGR